MKEIFFFPSKKQKKNRRCCFPLLLRKNRGSPTIILSIEKKKKILFFCKNSTARRANRFWRNQSKKKKHSINRFLFWHFFEIGAVLFLDTPFTKIKVGRFSFVTSHFFFRPFFRMIDEKKISVMHGKKKRTFLWLRQSLFVHRKKTNNSKANPPTDGQREKSKINSFVFSSQKGKILPTIICHHSSKKKTIFWKESNVHLAWIDFSVRLHYNKEKIAKIWIHIKYTFCWPFSIGEKKNENTANYFRWNTIPDEN
jgi:hypothetical protein